MVLIGTSRVSYGAFLVAQLVKNLPSSTEDMGLIPGSGRPLEKEMTSHFNILAWEIPWTQELSRLQSMQSQELNMT